MTKTLARSLSRKKVMTSEGKMIGTLKNIIVDFESGAVVDLIVQPDPSFDTSGYRMDGDKLFISFEAVKDIKDYIVIDRYLAKK